MNDKNLGLVPQEKVSDTTAAILLGAGNILYSETTEQIYSHSEGDLETYDNAINAWKSALFPTVDEFIMCCEPLFTTVQGEEDVQCKTKA